MVRQKLQASVALMADMRLKENKDLLQTVKDRYEIMVEADEDNRREAMIDMKFTNVPGYQADEDNRREAMIDMKFTNVPGYQWEDNMKQERGNRPCYEFNKIRISCKRIINDMRANRPAGKVRAVEGGDVEIAEINEGLIRNIWNVSDGDTIVDYAGEYQVAAGMGCWRVSTEYSDDTAFNQDIIIEPIHNPFTLYVDPSCCRVRRRRGLAGRRGRSYCGILVERACQERDMAGTGTGRRGSCRGFHLGRGSGTRQGPVTGSNSQETRGEDARDSLVYLQRRQNP
jgi:hypothetical protein